MDFATGGGGVVFSGTSSASFTNSGTKGTSMKNVTMNKTGGASFTLNNSVGVPANGSLTLTSGLLNTSSTAYLFLMDETCTAPSLSDASTSYINGPMRYDMSVSASTKNLYFPIGKGADCRPAVLTLRHGAATSYSYLAEVVNSPASFLAYTLPGSVDTVSGVRYWTINRSITSSGVSDPSTNLSYSAGVYPLIKLFFGTNDYVYQGSNLTIVKNTNGAPTTWIDIGAGCALGNSSSPQAGSVTSTTSGTPFNSFSTFSLASKVAGWNSLPVEFLSFTAKPSQTNVTLNWSTATEINNDHFDLERSQDGQTYEFVNKVKALGNGNSTITQNYASLDEKPFNGVSYYRLKQVDKNGAYKYSSIAKVNFNKKSFVSVYPNPALNNLTIDVSDNYLNASITITDALGNEVSTSTVNSYSNQLDISSLPGGVYYLSIIGDTDNSNLKFIVQK